MKKLILFLFCAVIFHSHTIGQAPEKFQYQVVVRDGNGDLVVNTSLTIKINILDSQQASEYEETHSVTTSDQGLALLVIGEGTTNDDFSDITWADGSHFISVAIDDGSGSGFVQYSTSELLSVPYALVANSVASNNTVSILDYGATPFFEDSDPDPTSEDSSAIQQAIDENPGKRILFPAGRYNIESQININESVELVGEGNRVTVINPKSVNAFVIKADWTTVKDMFIFGKSTAGVGLYLRNVNFTTIENVSIRDCITGIEIYNSRSTKIDKVDTFFNDFGASIKDGIRIRGNSVNNHIVNCHLASKDFAINVIKSSGDLLEGLTIGDTFLWGVKSGIKCTGILSLNVSNCIIDLSEEYALDISNTNGLLLSNNWIAAYTSSTSEAIHLVNANDALISNNNIKNLVGTRSISLNNVNNSTIIGNSIEKLGQSGDQIYIGAGSAYNVIKNNIIRSTSASGNSIVNQSGNTLNIIDDNIVHN